MKTCLKCGNQCKEEHDYCYNCYQNIIYFCDTCSKPIFNNESYTEYFEPNIEDYIYLCSKCNKKPNTNYMPRDKYKGTYRSEDGHLLKSKSELIIDNYLFQQKILHAYEKVIIDKNNPQIDITCDFYLPDYNIYIEFWGIKDNTDYKSKRAFKEKIYISNNLNKIDIEQKHIELGIDYYLEKELLKYKKGN